MHIDWIKDCVRNADYYYSKHADIERQKDNLSIDEIEEALLQGALLEAYADTGRGASCLVAGFTRNAKPLHIVCGRRGNAMAIITVYVPSAPKFKTIYERG